jgi:hypothetical protein
MWLSDTSPSRLWLRPGARALKLYQERCVQSPRKMGRSMGRVIAILASSVILAACSMSMPSMDFFKSGPSTDVLRVESEPPGADARTSEGQSCRTPCELTVTAAGEFSITYSLNGYQPQIMQVRADSDGGRLLPNPVYAELQPLKPPAGKKKSPPRKTAKKTTTEQAQTQRAQPERVSTSSSSSSASSAFPWPDPPR